MQGMKCEFGPLPLRVSPPIGGPGRRRWLSPERCFARLVRQIVERLNLQPATPVPDAADLALSVIRSRSRAPGRYVVGEGFADVTDGNRLWPPGQSGTRRVESVWRQGSRHVAADAMPQFVQNFVAFHCRPRELSGCDAKEPPDGRRDGLSGPRPPVPVLRVASERLRYEGLGFVPEIEDFGAHQAVEVALMHAADFIKDLLFESWRFRIPQANQLAPFGRVHHRALGIGRAQLGPLPDAGFESRITPALRQQAADMT